MRSLKITRAKTSWMTFGLVVSLVSCDSGAKTAQLTAGADTSLASSALTAGDTGPIHPQKSSGKCLDIKMGSQTNGAAVQLATCYGDAAQNWTFTGSQLKVFGNKCLDVTDGVQQNGVKLQIWDCDGNNANQQWAQQGQTFVWRGKYCMDLTDGNTNDLTLIQIWECGAGNVNQQWNGSGGAAVIASTNNTPTAPQSSTPASSNANSGSSADSYSSNAPGPSSASMSQPGNSISVTDYGVKNDGSGDNTQSMQNAINTAASQGKSVWFPEGIYAHSGLITINGVKVYGAGAKTILRATAATNSAIALTGNNAALVNLSTQVSASGRTSMPNDCAVVFSQARNATVAYVYAQGASANGFRIDNSDSCTLTRSIVNGSNADGIALVNGATNNTISYSQVVSSSDDAFSSDNYADDVSGKRNSGNTFKNCYAGPNRIQGRSFVFMGSVNETLTNSVSDGGLWYSIMAGADPGSRTLASSGLNINNVLVINNHGTGPIGLTTDNNNFNAGGIANVSGISTSGDAASFLGWTPATNLPDPTSFNSYAGGGDGANGR